MSCIQYLDDDHEVHKYKMQATTLWNRKNRTGKTNTNFECEAGKPLEGLCNRSLVSHYSLELSSVGVRLDRIFNIRILPIGQQQRSTIFIVRNFTADGPNFSHYAQLLSQ